MGSKKIGRPTDNPLLTRIGFRLDNNTLEKLDKYCRENGLERSDAIRKAIVQYISK